jgi:hypothetical protein
MKQCLSGAEKHPTEYINLKDQYIVSLLGNKRRAQFLSVYAAFKMKTYSYLHFKISYVKGGNNVQLQQSHVINQYSI